MKCFTQILRFFFITFVSLPRTNDFIAVRLKITSLFCVAFPPLSMRVNVRERETDLEHNKGVSNKLSATQFTPKTVIDARTTT